jgi:toxin ParE1/3/4
VRVTFSPAASDDLSDIADYIAQDNPARASSFIDELEARCEALSLAPGIGTKRPELGSGICCLPHGRYLIFYRAARTSLRIERIMHSARDTGEGDLEPR